MALKGTDIVKKLPDAGKKNCRECGFPTCFAFAMKLASGGVHWINVLIWQSRSNLNWLRHWLRLSSR